MKMQVIKRDGSVEEYSEFKIIRVMIATGINPEQAQKLSAVISKILKQQNLQKVSSLKIRDEVIERLKKINQDAANLFSWYQKTKE